MSTTAPQPGSGSGSSQPTLPYPATTIQWLGLLTVLVGTCISTLNGRLSTCGLADIRVGVSVRVEEGAWITTAQLRLRCSSRTRACGSAPPTARGVLDLPSAGVRAAVEVHHLPGYLTCLRQISHRIGDVALKAGSAARAIPCVNPTSIREAAHRCAFSHTNVSTDTIVRSIHLPTSRHISAERLLT